MESGNSLNRDMNIRKQIICTLIIKCYHFMLYSQPEKWEEKLELFNSICKKAPKFIPSAREIWQIKH